MNPVSLSTVTVLRARPAGHPNTTHTHTHPDTPRRPPAADTPTHQAFTPYWTHGSRVCTKRCVPTCAPHAALCATAISRHRAAFVIQPADERSAMLHTTKARDSMTRSGFAHAFANLLKTMVGSGILTLPYVTARVGLGLSISGLAVLAYLTQLAIRLVVRCTAHERSLGHRSAAYAAVETTTDDHGGGSWQLISSAAYGTPGWMCTSAALLTAQLGVASSYLDFISQVIVENAGLEQLSTRVLLWVILTSMSLLRRMRSVAVLSMSALAVYGLVFALLVVYGMQAPPRSTTLVWFDASGLGAWFGPSLFAFEGMGTALAIYESMQLSDPRPYFNVVSSSYVVAVALYGGVAAVGYVAWGDSVAQVVIDSFPSGAVGLSAKVMLAAVLLLTYPLQMTAPFQLLESSLPTDGLWWAIGRAGLIALTATASYAIPNMEQMVSLTGAVAMSSIGFVLPGAIFLKLRPPTPDGSGAQVVDVVGSVAMIVLGVIGGCWGVYSTLVDI